MFSSQTSRPSLGQWPPTLAANLGEQMKPSYNSISTSTSAALHQIVDFIYMRLPHTSPRRSNESYQADSWEMCPQVGVFIWHYFTTALKHLAAVMTVKICPKAVLVPRVTTQFFGRHAHLTWTGSNIPVRKFWQDSQCQHTAVSIWKKNLKPKQ
jgi:hypothetical protein